jgi:hypothetical protein
MKIVISYDQPTVTLLTALASMVSHSLLRTATFASFVGPLLVAARLAAQLTKVRAAETAIPPDLRITCCALGLS